jgi:nitroreductase
MDFWDVIEGRHSIRDYRPDPVPPEKLERLMHAASLAPSSMNAQPWRFHVAAGETRAEIGRLLAQATVHLEEYIDQLDPEHYEQAVAWFSSLGGAPVVVGVSMAEPASELERLNGLLAIGGSIENLMLAATDEGLASCNITFGWWVRDELAEALEVGDGRTVVALIVLGYPSEVPPIAPPHRQDIADWLT